MKHLLNHSFLRTPLRIRPINPALLTYIPHFHAFDRGNHKIRYIVPSDEELPMFLMRALEPISPAAFNSREMYMRLSSMPQENLQFLLMQRAPSAVTTITYIIGIIEDARGPATPTPDFFLQNIKLLLRGRANRARG